MYNKKHIISLGVSVITFNELISEVIKRGKARKSGYACFANSHMTIEAYQDESYRKMVNNSNFTLADGVPLQKSLKLIHNIDQERVAGMDFMPAILKEAEKTGIVVYLYGSTNEVLKKINHQIELLYPNLNVGGMHSPPFRTLSEQELQYDIDQINSSGAGIVLVALGCPKQEKWMASNSNKINAMLLGVGGAFPLFAGIHSRAPKWIRDIGMEWGFRLFQEPKRLLKRYLITNTIFLIQLGKQFIRSRF